MRRTHDHSLILVSEQLGECRCIGRGVQARGPPRYTPDAARPRRHIPLHNEHPRTRGVASLPRSLARHTADGAPALGE